MTVIDNNGFLVTPITPSMLEKAKIEEKILVPNSRTRDIKKRIVGFIGEQVVKEIFYKYKKVDSIKGDFIHNGKLIEVKTKPRNVVPAGIYECTIPYYTAKFQECDYYMFLSLKGNTYLNKYYSAYVVGSIKRDSFFEKAELLKAGTRAWNGVVYSEDTYSLLIKDLNRPWLKNKKD